MSPEHRKRYVVSAIGLHRVQSPAVAGPGPLATVVPTGRMAG
jgi:hypothetical protein